MHGTLNDAATWPRRLSQQRRVVWRVLSFLAGITAATAAAANPWGAQVVHGNASFANPDARTLEITTSPSAILNWQGFDIGLDETTRFIQDSAASAVLNRVVSGNASEILGNLISNGRVFLINPAGILIGRDATVDTAGLVMSTLDMSDRDFLDNELRFTGGEDAAPLTNHGYIKSAPGGEIILIAPRITNEALPGNPASGLIESPGGELVLAAGHAVTIASLDHPDVTFEVRAPDNEIVNLGRLIATGGSAGLFAGSLRHSGEINADALHRDAAGNIVLDTTGTTYLDANSIVTASGDGAGGNIEVNGERVYALGSIAASGARGGTVGVVADRVLLDGSVAARGLGDGGEIAITTDTQFLATAAARVDTSGAGGAGGRLAVDGGESAFTSATMTATGIKGGEIEILGDEVTLAAATLDASGDLGGGDVRVGGGFRGGEGLRAAASTTVNASSVIKADAITHGDGGTVAVWADGETRFDGVISATGGETAGDGGTVEVSGKLGLGFSGFVDVTALSPAGTAGSLLLDPKNIIFTSDATGAGSFSILDPNPGANNNFGSSFQTFFENGDFSTPAKMAVFDPLDDFGGSDAGAVYLYRMSDGALLSTLTGANAGDQVGATTLQSVAGVRVLRSSLWNGGRGAITVYDVVNGVSGVVGSGNSLVGANAGDNLGSFGIQALGTRIAVRSPDFNGMRGAVTIAAAGSLRGVVGAGNSLVGANPGDALGSSFFQSLFNGNVVVTSDHGTRGAVTFINPLAPPTGIVSASNSLVGAALGDQIGSGGVSVLGTAYAVLSPDFNGTAGAMTIGSTSSGVTGTVGAGNSLVGAVAGDLVGDNSPTSLFTGRYALISDLNGFGAVTVFDPLSPTVGAVNAGNSLIGAMAGDEIGSGGIQSLGSNTFAVLSPGWDVSGIITDAGAVSMLDASTGTFAGSATPFAGNVSAANSLVGASTGDAVGSDGIFTFVAGASHGILSPQFDNGGAVDAGAISWYVSGNPLTGTVSNANSLLGSFTNDDVGGAGNDFEFLFSGHTLLVVPNHNSGAGAVVFLDSAGPVIGDLGAATALVGGSAGDDIGGGGVIDLFTHYAVLSPDVDGVGADAGAVTVADASTGITGTVAAGNSLVGAGGGDRIGSGGLFELNSGNAVVLSPNFNGDAGAATFLDLLGGSLIGDADFAATVDNTNSLVGAGAGDFGAQNLEVFSDHYVVLSPLYLDSVESGAVTVADDVAGIAGTIGVANSLVGLNAFDRVGSGGLQELNNGNVLVLSPEWDSFKGAVTYLDLNGGSLIGDADFAAGLGAANSLVGNTANDQIGSDGVSEFFAGGNTYYGVFSGSFDNGGAADAGAVTFADSASGAVGVVSNTNSLVGTNVADQVGSGGFQSLFNGNIVLTDPQWNGNRGAATFVDLVGASGLSGDIGAGTSLVGAAAGDQVGSGGINVLFGANLYTVSSPDWANGGTPQAGALTFGDLDNGITGTVGAANSLLGSTTGDDPGSGGVSTVFAGGITRVFVESPDWDNGAAVDAGAVTTFDSMTPVVGAIGAGNSLVGNNTNDRIGNGFQRTLSNGNRLLVHTGWNGNAGAVTFWDTSADITGTVGAANSLIGSNPNDFVGNGSFREMGNGRFYQASSNWNGNAGAVTYGSITTGVSGAVSAANSLVGSNAGDRVGQSVIDPFASDRYLVVSENWNGVRGAVTVINPDAPITGVVSAANSLVGSSAGDRVGDVVQQLFQNDNAGLIVLRSNSWNSNSGAVTLFDPANPIVGTVRAANSLVGRPGDFVGSSGVSEFSNGTLLVRSPQWSDGSGQNFGAATFMLATSPVTPVTGFVGSDNSLVGSHLNDAVGSSFQNLNSGNILLRTPAWFDNRGAVTFVDIGEGISGTLSNVNSLTGELANDFLGSGGITNLGGDRALVRSPLASVDGIAGAGRLDIIDGTTVQSVSGDIGFASNPGGELLVSTRSIESFLNGGGTLLLQANNDIILPSGAALFATGGALFLEAGRSIEIADDLVVRNGSLSLLANSPNGDAAFRDAGEGTISLIADADGTRILAANVDLDAQNIIIQGGDSPGAFAAVIGTNVVNVHAHGSGLLSLTGGTAPGSALPPASSLDIFANFLADPDSVPAPAAFIASLFGLSVVAEEVRLTGGGSEGALAALASFGEFTVEAIDINLFAGDAANADALLLGLGGLADISFTNCEGCEELLLDPLFDSNPQTGIYIAGLFQEPTIDAILAMLNRDGDEEEGEEEDEDAAGVCY